jgi:cytochrome c551/c552
MNLLGKSALFFSFSLLASHSFAADAMALAQKNNCLACHSVDTKIVGPDVVKYFQTPRSVFLLPFLVHK